MSISKYFDQLASSFRSAEGLALTSAEAKDFVQTGVGIYHLVDEFCTKNGLTSSRKGLPASFSNESLDIDGFMAAAPVDSLVDLVKRCGVADHAVKACCEKLLNLFDRTVSKSAVEAWNDQTMSGADIESAKGVERGDLGLFHSQRFISDMSKNITYGAEAFGATMDMVVPDMKVNIAIAIMSFHARILPRLLPQRPINEPLAQYKKETLEAYDLSDPFGKKVRQVEMYSDPKFVSTELQRVVPRVGRDADGQFVLADGILKFGVKANILQLAVDADKYGYDGVNRTDILSDRVLLDFVRIGVAAGGKQEVFDVKTPVECRLSRQINAADSGDRYGDFKYRVVLGKDAKQANGDASEIVAGLAEGEKLVLSFNVKPFCSVKFGWADALGNVSMSVIVPEGATASEAATAIKAGAVALQGYALDARYDEVNLRKSNIAIWSNVQPMAWDIPTGRNFIYDYALNQQNTEKVAANMMGVMGIAQDRDSMDFIVDICNTVYDGIKAADALVNSGDEEAYIGRAFVAGDKVRPTVYMDTLDFSDLNIIRDGDRSGDIKQKAVTYLGAVTGKILNESFLQQQLGGKSQVVFKCWCSIEVLSNIIGQTLYNPGIAEDVRGNIGDGVEYSLVLPNKVRLDFVTTTFANHQDKIVGVVVVESAESELNFGHNWDYGVLVSHYTVSGKRAHNRLFGNMRYLIVPTNPVAFVIDILGMDVVTGMALENKLRPTFRIESMPEAAAPEAGTGTTTGPTGTIESPTEEEGEF